MQVWGTAFRGSGGYQPAGQRLQQASAFCCLASVSGNVAVADQSWLSSAPEPGHNRLIAAGEVKLQPDGGVKEIDPEVAGIIQREKDRQASASPYWQAQPAAKHVVALITILSQGCLLSYLRMCDSLAGNSLP